MLPKITFLCILNLTLIKGGETMVRCILKNEIETRVLIAEKRGSLKSFAEGIGISQTYLSQILKGTRNPSPNIAHKISKGLDKNINDIFLIRNVTNDNHQLDREEA